MPMYKKLSGGSSSSNWSGSKKSTATKSAGVNPAPRAVTQGPGSGKTGLGLKPQGMNPARGLKK